VNNIKIRREKMKKIINALVTFGALWLGNEYFNEYIAIDNIKTMIIAVALMFAIDYIYGLLMIASFVTIPIGVGCLTMIVLVLVAFILTPLKLYLLDTYLIGFDLNGFWTYLILTGVLSIFTINISSKTTTEKSQ
jgi:uncharacterized membrane protein YvlD (DUF360 family)